MTRAARSTDSQCGLGKFESIRLMLTVTEGIIAALGVATLLP